MHVLVVHRVHLFAEALAEHLRRAPGVVHVDTAFGADECVPALGRHRYDLVVLTRAGMERCIRLRRTLGGEQSPRPKIVVVSSSLSPGLMAEAARARMNAVVDVNQPVETLAIELAEVVAGNRRLAAGAESPGSDSRLGDGPVIAYNDAVDVQLVRLVATGMCDKAIAAQIHLSTQTVRNRISRILRDSHVDNRTHLASVYLRHEGHILSA